MATVLVPIIIGGGIALVAAALGAKKKTTTTDEGAEDVPITERPGYGQAAAYLAQALREDVRDLTYLGQTANWLDAQGFPEFGSQVRNKWQSIKDWLELTPDVTKRPGYGQARAMHDQAMASGTDPVALNELASWLDANGFADMARDVRERAAMFAVAPHGGSSPVPTAPPVTSPKPPAPAGASTPSGPTAPEITVEPAGDDEDAAEDDDDDDDTESAPGAPPIGTTPAIAVTEIAPDVDPVGTVALARLLIARESGSGWKSALQPEVKAWQKAAGLGQDGKFGPGSALRMGEEVGILPRVRYWPLGEWRKDVALADYRAKVNALAGRIEPINSTHAAALRQSALAETGQGWPSSPAPLAADSRAKELAAIIASGDFE